MRNFILLFVICLLGLILRLTSLDKPDGLWNDEYMSWWISSFDFGLPLIKKVFSNCHMPLYYLFLKAWTTLFGNEDLILRLSSVFVGILAIISTYFLGKEYKNKQTGLICALFAALSGFLIYFSQEVRLYGLIFLISTWIAFFFIKATRNPTKFNLIMLLFCNFLLLITHTIGFVYVFFNLLIFSIIILKKKPEFKKAILTSYTLLALAFLPLIPFLFTVLTRETLSQNWGLFSFSKIYFTFVDYFTPIQTNITNSQTDIINLLMANNFIENIIIITLTLIAIYFIIRAIKNNEETLNGLSLCGLLYFFVLIIAALLGKLVLSTKYSTEIYPTLILLFMSGYTLKKTKFTQILTIIYFLITSIFLFFSPTAPQHMQRIEGHKTPAKLLLQANLRQDDVVILLYHQMFRYEKYLSIIPQNTIEVNKGSIIYYLLGTQSNTIDFKQNGKEKLKQAFSFDNEKEIENRFEQIYNKIPKGKKIAIIIPAQVAFFSSNDLKRITSDAKEYKRTPLLFMAFSYAKIKLINAASKYCKHLNTYQNGVWYVLTFEKM